ncbi:hypothetical protein [Candidatus Methylobacter oryzae]|uniref:Uncharacterized protein n=1 Tax=Candidatus Methylobacter oryzae TaxID=2497749 RepID=A0ABY3CGE3_9GAMM|nr:hypothetical protein [Candidatus Methylobacter oryzae]TRX02912.1 hypothetical protein EKO24_001105 [Candidatus Methylobacter oryzae]
MKKLIAVIALASGMGAAYADQPVALTDAQMDNVSAGSVLASHVQTGGQASALFGRVQVVSNATTSTTPVSISTSGSTLSIATGVLVSSSSNTTAKY